MSAIILYGRPKTFPDEKFLKKFYPHYAIGDGILFIRQAKNEFGCRHCRPFFKKVAKNPDTKSLPQTAFSFDTKGAKEKALQKENAVFMGLSLFEKSEPKTFKLRCLCILI